MFVEYLHVANQWRSLQPFANWMYKISNSAAMFIWVTEGNGTDWGAPLEQCKKHAMPFVSGRGAIRN